METTNLSKIRREKMLNTISEIKKNITDEKNSLIAKTIFDFLYLSFFEVFFLLEYHIALVSYLRKLVI